MNAETKANQKNGFTEIKEAIINIKTVKSLNC